MHANQAVLKGIGGSKNRVSVCFLKIVSVCGQKICTISGTKHDCSVCQRANTHSRLVCAMCPSIVLCIAKKKRSTAHTFGVGICTLCLSLARRAVCVGLLLHVLYFSEHGVELRLLERVLCPSAVQCLFLFDLELHVVARQRSVQHDSSVFDEVSLQSHKRSQRICTHACRVCVCTLKLLP